MRFEGLGLPAQPVPNPPRCSCETVFLLLEGVDQVGRPGAQGDAVGRAAVIHLVDGELGHIHQAGGLPAERQGNLALPCRDMSRSSQMSKEPRVFNAALYVFQFAVRYFGFAGAFMPSFTRATARPLKFVQQSQFAV